MNMRPMPAWLRRFFLIVMGDIHAKTYLLILLGSFFLLFHSVLWIAIFQRIAHERDAAEKQAISQSNALVQIFAERTTRLIRQIDQASQFIKFEIESNAGETALSQILQKKSMLPSELSVVIALTDANGDVIASSIPSAPTNLAFREYFKAHVARDAGELIVDKPIFGKLSKTWTVPFSRRINKPDGSFNGIVLFAVAPAFLTHSYTQEAFGKQGLLAVVAGHGRLLARRIDNQVTFGDQLDLLSLQQSIKTSQQNFTAVTGLGDGVKRYASVQALEYYPLIAIVGLAEDEMLAPFRQRRMVYLKSAALTSVVITLFSGLLLLLGRRVATSSKHLSESQRLLQAILDNSTAVICVKDREGRYLLINRRYEDLFHVTRDQIVGKTDYDIFSTERADAFRALDRDVLAIGSAITAEEVVPQDDGVHTYLSVKAPFLDAAGKPYAVGIVSTDITERKQAEEELKRHRDHLEELVGERTVELTVAKERADVASQAKSTFLASMSHELRTPLNAVLGYAQILKRDKGLSERQTVGLNTIQQSGEHLLTLINDILDLAKIEAGKLDLYPNAFNLPVFLRTVGDIIRVKAEEKSLLFAFEMQADLPQVVHADEKRLRQILLNLLSNAVKFTDHGQIDLRVHCMASSDAPQEVPLGDAHAWIRFEVQDTGIGMTQEQLSKIFRPFEQVGEAQRRTGGTGLGLAISRQLIRLMDSDIQVESKSGAGSLFWFELSLPVEPDIVALLPREQRITGYCGPRKSVLIVDDVTENRAMLVEMLSALDFTICEAANGQDALAQVQALHPDLIVMDIRMPVMNGLDATRCLRQSPFFSKVPIIVVSASTSDSDQTESLAAGANAFLAKPIDQERLFNQIGELLGLSWVVEAPQSSIAQNGSASPLVVPPRHEMEVLHQLALVADMRAIREWAIHLAAQDRRYDAFADNLCGLATRYQSKAILGLAEEYRDHPEPDDKVTP